MKRLTKLSLLVLAISVSLLSCKKEAERESKFTLNNIDHSLDHGYLIRYGYNETQSGYYLYLCSPELDIVANDITGYGDVVAFMLTSNDPDELLAGDYSYGTNIYAALVLLSYDETLDEGIQYSLDTSGTIEASINISGDIYEIELTLDLETGKTLTGYYKGTLEYSDVSSAPAKSLTLDFWN